MKLPQFFLTFFLLLFSITVFAGELFVSATTGKNSNPGTMEAPLKGLWKAIAKAAPGDTILVAEGSYYGKMSCGWISVDKPLLIYGGYSKDFQQRDPQKFHTFIRPKNAQNGTKPVFASMTVDTRKYGPEAMTVINGFIFDHTDANNYHATEGKPEGVAEGMLMLPPSKGSKPIASIDRGLLHTNSDGVLSISDCLFLNASNHALNINHFSGTIQIKNNLFIGSRMAAVDAKSTNGKPFAVDLDFSNNTVLFTWTRTKGFEDMGYGFRANTGITAKIMNNIFGFSCTAGIDNTKGDPKQKSIVLEGNIFFLNKKSDITLTLSPNILYAKVENESFEDLEDVEGMATVADNRSLKDPAIFKGIIDESYLRGFLAASYTEKVEYDENSPINQFREMFGLNKQGKITSKVSMFANPYPFESALKFWGAVKGCGAQNPAKQQ